MGGTASFLAACPTESEKVPQGITDIRIQYSTVECMLYKFYPTIHIKLISSSSVRGSGGHVHQVPIPTTPEATLAESQPCNSITQTVKQLSDVSASTHTSCSSTQQPVWMAQHTSHSMQNAVLHSSTARSECIMPGLYETSVN